MNSDEQYQDSYSEEDEQIYFEYSATLRIFGVIKNLNVISKNLGLEPTDYLVRGKRRRPKVLPNEFDLWQYKAPVPEERPLEIHINTLWNHIKGNKEYLKKLKAELTVDVFLGYRSNSGTAGIEVPSTCLEMFTELEVPFGLSIIIA